MNVLATERMLKAAELIATLAHRGQVDEQGVPYIEHPRFVSGLLPTTELKIIGFLHDVLEDTEVKEEDIRPIFGDEITDVVALLTRDKTEPYFDYIERLSVNSLARKVKLADLTHNTYPKRTPLITEKQILRNQKYHKAYDYLDEIERREG